MTYEEDCQRVFGRSVPSPPNLPATSWRMDEKWGTLVNNKMMEVEVEYATTLLEEIKGQNIEGDIVEFGVFAGDWLEQLLNVCWRIGLLRDVWGFDSFEGLPEVSKQDDLDCWSTGQYSADIEAVSKRLHADARSHLHLIKGWFSESLRRPEAAAIRRIAYARVDCDLYQPAVECLEFLTDRLSDGAILVFDDWTFRSDKGEAKALFEWSKKKQPIRLEFLCHNSVGHLYTRVHHV